MIDDALTQLQHVNKKAAKIAREVYCLELDQF